jgi:hypothetical protein
MPLFTYDDSLTAPRDEVRFLVGDVDSSEPLLSDPEVDYLVATQPTIQLAAVEAARRIAAARSRLADKTVDGLSISYSQQASAFLKLADTLAATSSTAAPGRNVPLPVATGTSEVPRVRLGMHAHYRFATPEWRQPMA